MSGVIARGEVKDDSIRLPKDEVIVMMVDDSRDTTVGVVLRDICWSFLLAFLEVQVDGLKREAKLGQNDGHFPGRVVWSISM